jgi:hypothetical protein
MDSLWIDYVVVSVGGTGPNVWATRTYKVDTRVAFIYLCLDELILAFARCKL